LDRTCRFDSNRNPPHGCHRQGHVPRTPALRWTFIALHVEAATHPELVQTRVGHSNVKLSMGVYGKLAGEMALAAEQATRLDALATKRRCPLGPDSWETLGNKRVRKGLKSPVMRDVVD